MTFAMWLFDPKTVVGAMLLIPIGFGCVGQKSYKTVVMAVSANLMILTGAQLNMRLTGIVTATMTSIVGLSLALYVPYDLVRRRSTFVLMQHQQEVGDRPLLATTRFRDISTPILEVVMVFSGQTMLVVLYMSELCRWHPPSGWFHPGLWVCGWVAQFMVYTQFGFNFTEEVLFWRHIMNFSFGKMQTKKNLKTEVVDVDWRELVFRSSLSFLVHAVYRVFVWITLPIYIASEARGAMNVVRDVVPLMYIICLSDLDHPVHIEGMHAMAGDEQTFERSQESQPLRSQSGAVD